MRAFFFGMIGTSIAIAAAGLLGPNQRSAPAEFVVTQTKRPAPAVNKANWQVEDGKEITRDYNPDQLPAAIITPPKHLVDVAQVTPVGNGYHRECDPVTGCRMVPNATGAAPTACATGNCPPADDTHRLQVSACNSGGCASGGCGGSGNGARGPVRRFFKSGGLLRRLFGRR